MTEVMNQRGSKEDTDDEFKIIARQSLSKTDNKGHRHNLSAMGNSNRGDTHQIFLPDSAKQVDSLDPQKRYGLAFSPLQTH